MCVYVSASQGMTDEFVNRACNIDSSSHRESLMSGQSQVVGLFGPKLESWKTARRLCLGDLLRLGALGNWLLGAGDLGLAGSLERRKVSI